MTFLNPGVRRSGPSCVPFSPYLDITQAPYNAVPDDSTDNSTAINSAITAAKALGYAVYVPPVGTFKFNSDLTVDGVVLFGWACDNTDSVLHAGTATADVLPTNGGSVQYLKVILQ